MVIGVTGSRQLDADPRLNAQIDEALSRVAEQLPSGQGTRFVVLSPLAEGADRIVAAQVLERDDSALEVVLPHAADDYAKDFSSDQSRAEFDELCRRARRIVQLPPLPRPKSYVQVGRHVVDQCDALIGLWDGEPAAGPGGTGDIIAYARARQCPIYWIHTEQDVPIVEERGRGLPIEPRRGLARYSGEKISAQTFSEESRAFESGARAQARVCGLDDGDLDAPCTYLSPHFVRADVIARRYQRRYVRAGTAIYVLAAASVAAAAYQPVFRSSVVLSVLGVVLMLAVLSLFAIGTRGGWRERWIDYRFLAERLRTAFYMSVAGAPQSDPRPPRHLSLSHTSTDWMVLAFRSILTETGPVQHREILRPGVRRFVDQAWLGDQVSHHRSAARRHQRAHTRLTVATNLLFGITLLLALFQVVGLLNGSVLGVSVFDLGTFLAIVLPAVAAALAGIRSQREFQRNAKRSLEMVNHLEDIRSELAGAETASEFSAGLREAEAAMAEENADWRVVVRFKDLEPT